MVGQNTLESLKGTVIMVIFWTTKWTSVTLIVMINKETRIEERREHRWGMDVKWSGSPQTK